MLCLIGLSSQGSSRLILNNKQTESTVFLFICPNVSDVKGLTVLNSHFPNLDVKNVELSFPSSRMCNFHFNGALLNSITVPDLKHDLESLLYK